MVQHEGGRKRRGRRNNQGVSSWGNQSVINYAFSDDRDGLAEAEREVNLFESASAAKGGPASRGVKGISGVSHAASTSVIIDCHGIEVRFPFKPYPSQKDMMDKIVQAIQEQTNALLESPTGSGKSLAILCAALGWLESEKQKLRIQEQRDLAEQKARLAEAMKECDQEVEKEITSPYFAPSEVLNPLFQEASLKHAQQCADGTQESKTLSVNQTVQLANSSTIPDSVHLDNSKEFRSTLSTKTNELEGAFDEPTDTDDDFQQDRVKRRKGLKIEYDECGAANNKGTGRSKLGIDLSSFAYAGESSSSKLSDRHVDGVTTPPEYFPSIPKIIFCSRTHKQIAQLIRELRTKTPYRPPMALLGSRSHYCVNLDNSAQDRNEGCQNLLEERPPCIYYLRNEELVKQLSSKIWDMEDIVKMGHKKTACPYYAARALAKHAEIIFCPYNYIVHPQIRKAMDVNIDNTIIIIDEAHNIEDVARDAGGHDITLDTLIAADSQLNLMIEENIKAEACKMLQMLVIPFKKIISEQAFTKDTFEGGIAKLKLDAMMNELARFGFSQGSVRDMERASETLNKALREKAEMKKQREMEGRENSWTGMTQEQRDLDAFHLSLGILRALDGLIVVLKRLFDTENNFKEDYQVVIIRALATASNHARLEEDHDNDGVEDSGEPSKRYSEKNQKSRSRRKVGGVADVREVRTLSFWCLNPGVVFRELGRAARSVVLTSGTLSPTDSFASELQTTFPITLEASHVVDGSQVWAGAFSCGPKQQQLKGVFQNTRTLEYQDEIGSALERIISVVPNGVLCFMTSYGLIDTLMDRWRDTGQWDRLANIKRLFVEPRKGSSKEFDLMLKRFYGAVSSEDRSSGGGALLLAVFRGKCSEGIDFTDKNCRAVIAVGIPYPALLDDKVKLKKEYNDRMRSVPRKIIRVAPASVDIPNHSFSEAERIAQDFGQTLEKPAEAYRRLLSGQRWYEIQAFRAYNQAIGRCIRHRKDWGAMIFLDCRMQAPENRHALSKWIRPLVRNVDKFDGGIEELRRWMAPLLGANGSYWQGLENKRLEKEADAEEQHADMAEETCIKEDRGCTLRSREQLKSEDGVPLLSFCLDTGAGSGIKAHTDPESRTVKAEPPKQAPLEFRPTRQGTLMQSKLPFQLASPNQALDTKLETGGSMHQQESGRVQSFAAGSTSEQMSQKTAAVTKVNVSSQEPMLVDEGQDHSDDEFHDAPQHLEDGDSSMLDLSEGSIIRGSQDAQTSVGSTLNKMGSDNISSFPDLSTKASLRGKSVEMQSPPITPTRFKRQGSFSTLPVPPRLSSFTSIATQATSPPRVSPLDNQFSHRATNDFVRVVCKQCNTQLVTCNMRPKVQTVYKLVARELILNAKRPTRMFSRSSSSSSLMGSTSNLSTQVSERSTSSASQPNGLSALTTGATKAPLSAMVLMLPAGSVVTKDYVKASPSASPLDTGFMRPWQTEGLVFQPVICWTCRTNQALYPPQPTQTSENDELPFGHEKEPGWRGVFVASLAPRLLSFGSGSASTQSIQPSSKVEGDQSLVGQAWFAPKEIRVVHSAQ